MSLFFVSLIMHIFLKAYLSFRSKYSNYTHFHVPHPHPLLYAFNIVFYPNFVLKISGSTDPCPNKSQYQKYGYMLWCVL